MIPNLEEQSYMDIWYPILCPVRGTIYTPIKLRNHNQLLIYLYLNCLTTSILVLHHPQTSPDMKIPAALQKLKRRCSIRKKKTFAPSRRTKSVPFIFQDDNLPLSFSPMRTSTNKSQTRFKSTPNLKSKKSVSFRRSGKPSTTLLAPQDLPCLSSFESQRSTSSKSLKTSLETLADDFNLTRCSLEPVFEDPCSECKEMDCLVCVMTRPELRGRHPEQIKPAFLRSFDWDL